MAEALDASRLKKLAASQKDPVVARRLGWLLEQCGLKALAEGLKPAAPAKLPWRPVAPGTKISKSDSRNETWRLIENHSLDLEP
jgi:hypothetical protein